MANRTKSGTNQDHVSTTSTKSRASSRQINNSINQLNDYRLQEKKELQTLNDRLANHFQRERELEKEKQSLEEQLRNTLEDCDNKIQECKLYYDEQVNNLRLKLDVECTNSAKKSLEYEKFKTSLKEAQKENSVLLGDLKQFEKKNAVLSNDLDKLREKVNSLSEDNEQLRKLIQQIETEKNEIEKTSKKNLAQAETEKLRSISLEGRLKALEEKCLSEKHFYEKEIEEIRLKSEEERDDQIEEAIQSEIEYLKTELMIKSRRELEENITKIKLDLEKSHLDELNKLKDQLNKSISSEKQLKSKLNSHQTLIDRLNAKILECNQNESRLNSRIVELEGLLEIEKNEKQELIEVKNREIKDLEEELKLKDGENQLVLDTNVQLNEEIRIYRNLLDEQEKSLEASDLNSSSSNKAARASSPTVNRRYAQAARKRKRNIIDHINETTIVNKSVGPIAIDESTDQFIRLINRADSPIPLAGWELKRENDENGYSFKFNKSIIIQPNETLTVYSADAEDAVHDPPVSLKLKKNWPIGGVTILYNANKEEIAKWEWSSSSKRSRFSSVADDANKSCNLM